MVTLTQLLEDDGIESVTTSGATEDDIPGPGLILDKAITKPGEWIEIFCRLVLERLGHGPNSAFQRLVEITAAEREGTIVWTDKRMGEKVIKRDCKALLRGLGSPLTRVQIRAVEDIINFMIDSAYLRDRFRSYNVIQSLKRMETRKSKGVWEEIKVLTFRCRQALMVADEVEIFTLAKSWNHFFQAQRFDDGKECLMQLVQQANRFPEKAFLVFRYLDRCGHSNDLYDWLGKPIDWIEEFWRSLGRAFIDELEWEHADNYFFWRASYWDSRLFSLFFHHADKLPWVVSGLARWSDITGVKREAHLIEFPLSYQWVKASKDLQDDGATTSPAFRVLNEIAHRELESILFDVAILRYPNYLSPSFKARAPATATNDDIQKICERIKQVLLRNGDLKQKIVVSHAEGGITTELDRLIHFLRLLHGLDEEWSAAIEEMLRDVLEQGPNEILRDIMDQLGIQAGYGISGIFG